MDTLTKGVLEMTELSTLLVRMNTAFVNIPIPCLNVVMIGLLFLLLIRPQAKLGFKGHGTPGVLVSGVTYSVLGAPVNSTG